MSEMVERVARALARSHLMVIGRPSPVGSDPGWEYWEFYARGAIAAMREPTEEMIEAFIDEDCHQADLPRAYAAMIDAALTPPVAPPAPPGADPDAATPR